MKVNPESLKPPVISGEPKAAINKAPTPHSSATQATSGSTPVSGDASIELSSASRGLQTSDVNDASSFDAKRVDQIKQAITQGRFQVNSHAVADKLIASVQDLLTAQAGKGH